MGKYRSYSEYKDSGVEWLGEVPSHWHTQRFKHLFRVSIEKNGQHVVGKMLSVSGYRGIEIKEYEDEAKRRTEEELTEYRVVRKGQLVVNTMWLNYAGLGVSDYEGHVSPAYRSYWMDESLDGRFIHNLLRSSCYVAGYTKYMQGIRPNSLQIKTDDFAGFPVLLPPSDEQTQIATFLDRETAKIDRLIAKQEALIELLKEKRQAVISHAVTKGLDPDAPMKDSGVEWLGEIPAHWKVLSLARVTTAKCDGPFGSGIKSEHYAESGARVVRLQNIGSAVFNDGNAAFLDLQYFLERLTRHRVVEGDLLIAGLGDANNPVGRACVAPSDLGPSLVKADCFCFQLDRDLVNVEFVALLLSVTAKADGGTLAKGTTRSRISLSVMASRKICLPSKEEQERVVEIVKDQLAKFDILTGKAEAMISLLQERRTALISAAVTGKIDVREEVKETLPSIETAMAVEILSRCAAQCGRTKLQKLLFLSEHHAQIDMGSNYCRQAAGPLDGSLLDRVESELESFGYYKKHAHADGTYSYLKLENAGGSILDSMLPQDKKDKGTHIVSALADKNTHECEVVATIYGAWNDLLIAGKEASRTIVIDEVMNNWHQSKRIIPRSEWVKWFDWVAANLRPVGYGKATKQECMQKSLLD